jgi:hypothetical protein
MEGKRARARVRCLEREKEREKETGCGEGETFPCDLALGSHLPPVCVDILGERRETPVARHIHELTSWELGLALHDKNANREKGHIRDPVIHECTWRAESYACAPRSRGRQQRQLSWMGKEVKKSDSGR